MDSLKSEIETLVSLMRKHEGHIWEISKEYLKIVHDFTGYHKPEEEVYPNMRIKEIEWNPAGDSIFQNYIMIAYYVYDQHFTANMLVRYLWDSEWEEQAINAWLLHLRSLELNTEIQAAIERGVFGSPGVDDAGNNQDI